MVEDNRRNVDEGLRNDCADDVECLFSLDGIGGDLLHGVVGGRVVR